MLWPILIEKSGEFWFRIDLVPTCTGFSVDFVLTDLNQKKQVAFSKLRWWHNDGWFLISVFIQYTDYNFSYSTMGI